MSMPDASMRCAAPRKRMPGAISNSTGSAATRTGVTTYQAA